MNDTIQEALALFGWDDKTAERTINKAVADASKVAAAARKSR